MQRNFNFSPDEYYHVYSRGVDKRQIFLDHGDYQRFIRLLYLANSYKSFNFYNLFQDNPKRNLCDIEKGGELISIGAWCLMPNHFHLLIKDLDLCEDRPHIKEDK